MVEASWPVGAIAGRRRRPTVGRAVSHGVTDRPADAAGGVGDRPGALVGPPRTRCSASSCSARPTARRDRSGLGLAVRPTCVWGTAWLGERQVGLPRGRSPAGSPACVQAELDLDPVHPGVAQGIGGRASRFGLRSQHARSRRGCRWPACTGRRRPRGPSWRCPDPVAGQRACLGHRGEASHRVRIPRRNAGRLVSRVFFWHRGRAGREPASSPLPSGPSTLPSDRDLSSSAVRHRSAHQPHGGVWPWASRSTGSAARDSWSPCRPRQPCRCCQRRWRWPPTGSSPRPWPVARHAHAGRASVTVSVDHGLCLEIQDDGTAKTANGTGWRPGVGLQSWPSASSRSAGPSRLAPLQPAAGSRQACHWSWHDHPGPDRRRPPAGP